MNAVDIASGSARAMKQANWLLITVATVVPHDDA